MPKDDPPVIPLIAPVANLAAGGNNVLLELALPKQVIVAVVRLVGLGALAQRHPRHQRVLARGLVPPPPAGALLQGPDVDEGPAARGQAAEHLGEGVAPPLPRGQVVDDGDADDEVDGAGAVGERQAVGGDDVGGALGAGEPREGGGPVRREHVQRRVDGDVFAVAAADVEPDAAGGEGREELLDEGPGLVARRAEVRRDGFVDGVHVGLFVGRWGGWRR